MEVAGVVVAELVMVGDVTLARITSVVVVSTMPISGIKVRSLAN